MADLDNLEFDDDELDFGDNSSSMPTQKFDPLPAAVLGAGGLALDAYGKQVGDYIGARGELSRIGKEFGIDPKAGPFHVPKGLADKMRSSRDQSSIKSFDADKVNTYSAKLADTIKTYAPEAKKYATDKFGKALDEADELAMKAGFELSNKQLSSNVFDKVIEEATREGIDEKQIKALSNVRENILKQAGLLDAKGKPIEARLSLSDAKAIISNVTREDPYSPLSAKIKSTWSNFLEKEVPKEIKPLYESINKNYKSFSEVRAFLDKLSDPKTGEYDTRKLAKYISEYTKGGGDAGVKKFMKFLSEGNDLIPVNKDISKQFSDIDVIKNERSRLVKIISGRRGEISKSMERANELLSITDRKGIFLNPGKAIGPLLGIGKGILRSTPGGVIENAMQSSSMGGVSPQEAISLFLQRQNPGAMQDLERRAREAMSL